MLQNDYLPLLRHPRLNYLVLLNNIDHAPPTPRIGKRLPLIYQPAKEIKTLGKSDVHRVLKPKEEPVRRYIQGIAKNAHLPRPW